MIARSLGRDGGPLDGALERRGLRWIDRGGHSYLWFRADSPLQDMRRQLTLSAFLLVAGITLGVWLWWRLH